MKANISSEGGQNAQDGIHKDPEGDIRFSWDCGGAQGPQAVRGSGASWEKRVPRLVFDELLVDFKSKKAPVVKVFCGESVIFAWGAEET